MPPHISIDYTYRMLHALFAGQAIVNRRRQKSDLTIAWHSAAFHRQKRLKPLKSLLRRLDPVREMNPSQMKAALVSAFTSLGATVIRRKKGEASSESEK